MNKILLSSFGKGIVEKFKNVNGILSIFMLVTLFLSWFTEWYNSQWNAHQSAFHVAGSYSLMWIIIICTIGLLVLTFLNGSTKSAMYGGISTVILIVMVICRLTMVGSGKFKSTAIGFKLMLVFSIIQIIYSFILSKKSTGK